GFATADLNDGYGSERAKGPDVLRSASFQQPLLGFGHLALRRGPRIGEIISPWREGLNPGELTPENQPVDIVRALVGIDAFEIHHMMDDAVLAGDAVASQHITRRSSNL